MLCFSAEVVRSRDATASAALSQRRFEKVKKATGSSDRFCSSASSSSSCVRSERIPLLLLGPAERPCDAICRRARSLLDGLP